MLITIKNKILDLVYPSYYGEGDSKLKIPRGVSEPVLSLVKTYVDTPARFTWKIEKKVNSFCTKVLLVYLDNDLLFKYLLEHWSGDRYILYNTESISQIFTRNEVVFLQEIVSPIIVSLEQRDLKYRKIKRERVMRYNRKMLYNKLNGKG